MTADRTLLTGFADRFADASARSAGALHLAEEPLWRMVNLRIAPTAAASVTGVLGAPLPLQPNTVTKTPTGLIVWLGPDEWLVFTPDDNADHGEFDAAVRSAAGPVAVSVVDVSAARTVIGLAGPAARDVLAHGCGLDLDAARFAPGTCAQTRLALADVVLIAPHDQPSDFAQSPLLLILVRASFASYLATWLLDAATDYLSG